MTMDKYDMTMDKYDMTVVYEDEIERSIGIPSELDLAIEVNTQ